MKTKAFTATIIMLFLVSALSVVPFSLVFAKSDNAATKIPIRGMGFPMSPPLDLGTMWNPSGGREHMRGFSRIFIDIIWSGSGFTTIDDRLTTVDPTSISDPPWEWIPYGEHTYYPGMNWNGFLIDHDDDPATAPLLDATVSAKEVLKPGAYQTGESYSGWWEGSSRGKMWVGEEPFIPFGQQYFFFKTVLHGQGDFKGLMVVFTVSSQDMVDTGFEIQGYILDTTQ